MFKLNFVFSLQLHLLWLALQPTSLISAPSLPSHPSATLCSHSVMIIPANLNHGSYAGMSVKFWKTICAKRNTSLQGQTRWFWCSFSCQTVRTCHSQKAQRLQTAWELEFPWIGLTNVSIKKIVSQQIPSIIDFVVSSQWSSLNQAVRYLRN